MLIFGPCYGQYRVDYNESAKKAYSDIIHLNFDSAQRILEQMKVDDPYNLSYVHVENYLDFFQLFIHERPSDFEQLKLNKARRIDLVEKLSNDDPFKKFMEAEINLQWAMARSKFDELIKAGREIYGAYRLLEQNRKEHPDFIYNYKSLSVIHSLIESVNVPGIFKSIFSVEGSIEQGLDEIDLVLSYADEKDFIFDYEAEAIRLFMMFYQNNDRETTFLELEKSRLKDLKSPLAAFVQVKLFQRAGRNDEAIALLSETMDYTTVKDFPYLYFLRGVSHLRKLEQESVSYFQEYLDYFEGLHYIKEAEQKLAWANLIFDQDVAAYKYHMNRCISTGHALIDDDKQALKEAKNHIVPNPFLLQARLLYDGGYYQKAYGVLIKNSQTLFYKESTRLEYFYRLGRVTQALKNYPEAVQYFHQTIGADLDQSSYMTCNSALQLGIIYEQQGEFAKAAKYYNQCLNLEPEEYKTSLHQKAKSGLDRVGY